MRLLILFTLILFAAPVFAESDVDKPKGRDYNINDLIYDCTKCSSDLKSDECIYCNGLITGTASTLALFEMGKSFCPPANMDTKLARNMFRRWAKDHKAKEDPAVAGIVAALQSSFPCDKTRSKAQPNLKEQNLPEQKPAE